MADPDRTSTGDGHDGRWRVERFAELDSTNRYALDRAREGADAGLVVVADHQSAGRGRLDRRWEAPPGSSLLVSVLLRPGRPGRPGGDAAHHAVVAVALAMGDAVAGVVGVEAGVKWPNDLVVGDRKLAGILAEAEGDALVVGVGCNVNWGSFPPELAATATACNLEGGRSVDRDELLAAFLAALAGHFDDPTSAQQVYRERLVTLGRRVRVERARGELVGEAVSVTDAGALVVRDHSGQEHEVVAGDVVHLRNARDAP